MRNPVIYYRVARYLHQRGVPFLPRLIDYFNRFVFACWLPHTASIGSRLVLGYGGLGVVIHGSTVIGDDVQIDQGVTIGGNATAYGAPTLEDGIYVGAGAKILGPITIGHDSVIGANAVVVKDVPANSLVVGVPGRVVRVGIDARNFLYHKRHPNYKTNAPNETGDNNES